MRGVAIDLRLAPALLLALSAHGTASEVSVRIEQLGEVYTVEAGFVANAAPPVAWRVLTDYDGLAGFVPGMRSSRIVSAPGEPVVLEQKGTSGILFLRVPIEVLARIDEVPMKSVKFQSIGGSLRNKRGEWVLAGHDHATRVEYRAQITPGFSLPPLLGPAIMGQNVRGMVEAVAREMARRARLESPLENREAPLLKPR